MLLLLNAAIWGTAVYSLKIALFGRPILSLLVATSKPLLEQASIALDPDGPDRDWDEEVSALLSKLAKFSIFSTCMLALEYILCFYFLSLSRLDPFAWFLAAKNLFFLYLSVHFQKRSTESNPISALLAIPAWAVRWERIAYFAGAVCLMVELLRVNKFL